MNDRQDHIAALLRHARPPAAFDVANASASLFDQALAAVRAHSALEHERIVHELEAGGRLRLVVDCCPDDPPELVRIRVRLLSVTGANRWVWSTRVAASAPSSRRALSA